MLTDCRSLLSSDKKLILLINEGMPSSNFNDMIKEYKKFFSSVQIPLGLSGVGAPLH